MIRVVSAALTVIAEHVFIASFIAASVVIATVLWAAVKIGSVSK